jgi:hypothetical protein
MSGKIMASRRFGERADRDITKTIGAAGTFVEHVAASINPSITVTLRWPLLQRPSKGDGPAGSSAVHPSRLRSRCFASQASRLRMTGLAA